MTRFAVARRLPQWPASLPAAGILCALLTASPPAANAQTAAVPEDARPTGLWERDRLTGDWGGLRTSLEARGITLGLTDTSEVMGNVSGGMKQGAVFDGKTEIDLEIDLEKLVGWTGGRFKVSAYQIHGRGLSADNIGNLLTVSNIEAVRGTRLADLYLEQSLFEDVVNIRIGQFAADEEFLTSDVAGVFINSTFGWPGINAVDLPGGGPAFPFSTPGIRVRYTPTDAFSLQAAAFNGNPLGQHGDQGGIEFPLDGRARHCRGDPTRPGPARAIPASAAPSRSAHGTIRSTSTICTSIPSAFRWPTRWVPAYPPRTPATLLFTARSITCCGASPTPRMAGCPASSMRNFPSTGSQPDLRLCRRRTDLEGHIPGA